MLFVVAVIGVAYFFGGYCWGVFLLVHLFSSKRLLAWTLPFVLGAACLAADILFVLFAQYVVRPIDYGKAHELTGWSVGGILVPPLFWWISAAIFCYFAYRERRLKMSVAAGTRIEMPLPPDE